jgi:hypothetical protein
MQVPSYRRNQQPLYSEWKINPAMYPEDGAASPLEMLVPILQTTWLNISRQYSSIPPPSNYEYLMSAFENY